MTHKQPFPHNYAPAKDLLKGHKILVTGAGDGIGRIAARTFAAHGATVILLGRTQSKLEAVYDEIEAAGHAQPALFPLDMKDAISTDYVALQHAIGDTFGELHGLLHNASILGERGPLQQANPVAFAEVMQVNVTAQMMLTQAMLPLLEQPAQASIVFTSSAVGRIGRAYWGAYGISKFATEGMMQTWAQELENTSSVRVNSLNPGAVRTSMRATAYPAEDPATVTAAEDIMPVYLWLMSADSSAINGQAMSAQPL